MISFFRKLRQRLLAGNQLSKYLLYALGEILLVVIGILIALQINNWNEYRKDRISELSFLTNLGHDLQNDIGLLDEIVSLDSSILDDLRFTQHDLLNLEDIEEVRFTNSRFKYRFFIPNKTTYENITSSGKIGLIQNDSIVELWMSYYRTAQTIRETTDESLKNYSRDIEDFYTRFDHVIQSPRLKRKTITDYRETPFVLNSLRYKGGLIIFQINNYTILKQQAQYLLQLITQEVSRLSG